MMQVEQQQQQQQQQQQGGQQQEEEEAQVSKSKAWNERPREVASRDDQSISKVNRIESIGSQIR